MSDIDKGRDLWRARHPQPVTGEQHGSDGTSPEDHADASAAMAAGRALWQRRKAGGTFALGPEQQPADVTPGGEAA